MPEQQVCPGLGTLWEPQHPECAGGPDPAFINPADGTNVRPKCPWFAQCAAATNANKLANARPNPQNAPVKIPVQQPQQPQQAAPGPFAAVARGLVQGITQVATQQAQPPQPAQQPRALVPLQMPQAGVQMQQQQQQQQYQQVVPVRPPPAQPWQPAQYQPQQFMQMPQYGQPQMAMVPPQMAMLPQAVPMNMQAPGMHILGYLAVPEPIMEGQHWASRLGFSILRSAFKASGHTLANFFDFNPFGSYPPNGG
jgi:hypothetical protein